MMRNRQSLSSYVKTTQLGQDRRRPRYQQYKATAQIHPEITYATLHNGAAARIWCSKSNRAASRRLLISAKD